MIDKLGGLGDNLEKITYIGINKDDYLIQTNINFAVKFKFEKVKFIVSESCKDKKNNCSLNKLDNLFYEGHIIVYKNNIKCSWNRFHKFKQNFFKT